MQIKTVLIRLVIVELAFETSVFSWFRRRSNNARGRYGYRDVANRDMLEYSTQDLGSDESFDTSTSLTTSRTEEKSTAASMLASNYSWITSSGHHHHIKKTEPFQTVQHLSATFFDANDTLDFTKKSQNERNTSESAMEDSSLVATYNDAVSSLSLEVIVGIVACALVVILLSTTIISLYRKRCVKTQVTSEERQNEIYEMEGVVDGGIETTSPGDDNVAADKLMKNNILYGTR